MRSDAKALPRLLALIDADPRSQKDIAGAAGMSPAQLSQIMTGHRSRITLAMAERLLLAIGKTWRDIEAPGPRRAGGKD